jgi:hypothetical protein
LADFTALMELISLKVRRGALLAVAAAVVAAVAV